MSSQHPQVVQEGDTLLQNNSASSGANTTKGQTYSKEQMSKFGTAFLPYASQLESVDRIRTIRKTKKGLKKKNESNEDNQHTGI